MPGVVSLERPPLPSRGTHLKVLLELGGGALWLWPLKLEEAQTSQADLGLEADVPHGGRTGNMS